MNNRLNSYLLIAFVILFGQLSWAQTTYAVNWENLVKATFTSPSLTRTTGSGSGTATSENMLYGGSTDAKKDGYMIYTPPSTTEGKKIGFSAAASNFSEASNEIDYGFSLLSNGKFKAYTADKASALLTYTAGQQLKVQRSGGEMIFYQGGAEILRVKTDWTETLFLRAELITTSSSFDTVRVSFNTKRLVVDPIIDNSNNTIQMQITSGFPPFSYSWEDGQSSVYPHSPTVVKKLEKGLHQLNIRDSIHYIFERAFLLGNNITWTNLENVTQSGQTLSRTSGGTWADARSTTTINQNDLFWVQYIAEYQNVSKGFGVCSSTVNFNAYTDFEAGFLLLQGNKIQIIHQGNVILTTEYNDRDALLLAREGKVMTWMINGQKVYEVTDVNFTTNLKVAALLKQLITTMTGISFYNLATSPLTTTWDDSKLTGTANVTISGLTTSTGPFHYYISEDPIPPLYDMYTLARDSIFDGTLDSLLFFEGNATQLLADTTAHIKTSQISLLKEHNFENLQNAEYYTAVFDKVGTPIYTGQIRVAPVSSLYNTDGITQDLETDLFFSSKDSATTDLNYYIDSALTESKLDFQLVNTNDKYSVGLSNYDDTITAIKYGFSFNKDTIQTVNLIVNGTVDTISYSARRNNILSLEKIEDSLCYKINGVTKFKTPLSGAYLYKTQLLLAKAGILIKIEPKKEQATKLYTFKTVISNASCDDNSTSLAFKFFKKTLLNSIPYQYNYTLTNLFDDLQTPITGSSLSGQNITNTNLPFGVYNLSGTITVSGTTSPVISSINETIYIGIEGQFDPVNHYSLSPNSYSLNSNSTATNNLNYAYGLSLNTIKENETGFVSFTPVNVSKFNVNYFSFNSDYGISLPNGMYLEIYRYSPIELGYKFYSNGVCVFTWAYRDDIRIAAQINATDIQFFANSNEINGGLIDRPTGDLHVKAMTRQANNGFKDVLFSFTCMEKPIVYTKLVEEVSAGFYVALESKIGFYFEEEYGIDANKTIPMKVYDKSHYLKGSVDLNGIGTIPAITYKENENMHILNLQPLSLNDNEFYTLEVTTISGEKRYLKFLNKN